MRLIVTPSTAKKFHHRRGRQQLISPAFNGKLHRFQGGRDGTAVPVRVLKFHSELAGEGVEYIWAHAKAYYRRMPVSKKRGRENFKQLGSRVTQRLYEIGRTLLDLPLNLKKNCHRENVKDDHS
jgi:hypothetical protein